MNKSDLITLLRNKKDSESIDLSGKNIEGLRSNLINIEKNEILFKPGNPAKSFFFVVSGEIMVTENDKVEVYKSKSYFGFEELETSLKRKSKAMGIEPSVVLEFIIHDAPASPKEVIPKISVNSSSKPKIKPKDRFMPDPNIGTDFESIQHNDLLIIQVNISKATLAYSKSFLNHINNEIERGHKNIIVDLRKCTLIDSTFLGSLVKSLRALSPVGGTIVLVYDSESQSTLFMITYMDKVFKTFDDVDQAVEYLETR